MSQSLLVPQMARYRPHSITPFPHIPRLQKDQVILSPFPCIFHRNENRSKNYLHTVITAFSPSFQEVQLGRFGLLVFSLSVSSPPLCIVYIRISFINSYSSNKLSTIRDVRLWHQYRSVCGSHVAAPQANERYAIVYRASRPRSRWCCRRAFVPNH
jgi:hypothetical protein